MSDLAETVAAPAVESTPATEAPVVSAPAAASESAPAPATEEFGAFELPPATEPAPAETPAAPEVKPATPTETPEVEPPAIEAPPEEKPAEPPAPVLPAPVVYTDFKVPEGLQIAKPERLTEFQAQLSGFGVPQEVAQKLLEQHVEVMTENLTRFRNEALPLIHKQAVEEVQNEIQKRQQDQRKGWLTAIASDAEISAGGKDEARAAVTRAVDALVKTPKERAEFDDLLKTGAGAHPAFWRLLFRAEQKLAGSQKFVTAPSSPAAPVASGSLYDHPTSPRRK